MHMNVQNTANKIYAITGYMFNDLNLLRKAITHSSYSNNSDHSEPQDSYERLEYLGDAVLQLLVSDILFREFPEDTEGKLTQKRSQLVSEASLSKIAKKFDIGGLIIFGKGEEQSGGGEKNSILADVIESLLGAIYLDAGEKPIKRLEEIVRKIWGEELKKIQSGQFEFQIRDFRSELITLCKKLGKATPQFITASEAGPDHDKIFTIQIVCLDEVLSTGVGPSKKSASQAAAKSALKNMNE